MNPKMDRRLFRRIEGEFAVRYSLSGSKKEDYAMTRDIGGGGLRMSVLKRIEPGTDIDLLVFKNSSNASSKCKGEVAWVSDKPIQRSHGKLYDVGIKFKNASFLCISSLLEELESQNREANLLGVSSQ